MLSFYWFNMVCTMLVRVSSCFFDYPSKNKFKKFDLTSQKRLYSPLIFNDHATSMCEML